MQSIAARSVVFGPFVVCSKSIIALAVFSSSNITFCGWKSPCMGCWVISAFLMVLMLSSVSLIVSVNISLFFLISLLFVFSISSLSSSIAIDAYSRMLSVAVVLTSFIAV